MVNFNFSFDPRIGLEQRVGFQMAAAIWSQFIRDDIDVNLQIVSSESLGEDGKAIGGAAPIFHKQQYGVYQEYLKADAVPGQSGEVPSVDEQALDSLQTGNTVDLMVNGEVIDGNTDILLTSAQAKALGMDQALTLDNDTTWRRDLVSDDGLDGAIFVSQKFDWSYDFTRAGEAPEGTIDFLSMALHEIGHQLGFVSSLDGTLEVQQFLSGDTKLADFTPLDLFRHSSASSQIKNPDGGVNDLSIGGDAYFSIDGGATNLGNFATGQNTVQGGDGQQASHWQRMQDALGIMDPTLAYKERLVIQERDLQALDVLGYEVNYGVLQQELNLGSLWTQAQSAVEAQMGLDSGTLAEIYGGGNNGDLYNIGYGQWWQIMEPHMLEIGYGQWWQILEIGYGQWWQQQEGEGELLEIGYGQWWQQLEEYVLEIGYGQWWQKFEAQLLEIGYGQWWQILEIGYGQWWQEIETFFAKVETGEAVPNAPAFSERSSVAGDLADLDVIQASASREDDIIGGEAKRDIILAGDGDDLIDGFEGNDILIGNAGADTIFGWDGRDILLGGEGDDRLLGENGRDELQGESGDDILSGGNGQDYLDGGEGLDQIYGDNGQDVLLGRYGDDYIDGGAGDDIAVGEEGRDVLHGGDGNDRLYGDRYVTDQGILHDTADFQLISKALGTQSSAKSAEQLRLSGQLQTDDGSPLILLNAAGRDWAKVRALDSGASSFTLEAEDLRWSGRTQLQTTDTSSGELVSNEERGGFWFWQKPQVESTFAFTGETGLYDIVFGYHDLDGTGKISLSRGYDKLGEITLDQDFDSYSVDESNFVLSTLKGVSLTQAEQLKLVIEANGQDKGYLDYVKFVPTTVESTEKVFTWTGLLERSDLANVVSDGISLVSKTLGSASLIWNDFSLGIDEVISEGKSLVSDAWNEGSFLHDNPGPVRQFGDTVVDVLDSVGPFLDGEFSSLLMMEESSAGYEFEAATATAPGSDILRGGDGDDQLYGGEGNDQLFGDVGNDLLVGSDRQAIGRGEQDLLTGGAGQDVFVLGDSDRAYYSLQGNDDYAFITDFDATVDQLVLHGSDYRYSQQQQGDSLLLHYRDDLVAVLQNTTSLNLGGREVQFI